MYFLRIPKNNIIFFENTIVFFFANIENIPYMHLAALAE